MGRWSLKSIVLVFCSPLGLLDDSPVGFQSQPFWEFVSGVGPKGSGAYFGALTSHSSGICSVFMKSLRL